MNYYRSAKSSFKTAWGSTASHHLNMDLDQDRQTDVLSQIRQIDYLLSKARGKSD